LLRIAREENNFDLVDILECRLCIVNEQEIRSRLQSSNLYEHLNDEKMTPHFLKLAKVCKRESSLDEIKRDDGTDFANNMDRREYILNFYRNLYNNNDDPDTGMNHDIENFLGREILESPLVQGSKLSPEKKQFLEQDLTLAELDASIDTAKINSAGGMDGISNRTLKKFWPVLRIPLHKYSLHMCRTGKLTDSFRSASIKLIPKKGDLTSLKNWRPISLLNCSYKIISRAINARLQKVAPTILSRSQKGFVKNRYIQEVLINVIEAIAYAKCTDTPGIVLAIDQSRAFDTISHRYMKQVYRFFNFGENCIRYLEAIGTNRTACLIWEDGTYSKNFDLKTGRTQGDGPSPLLYNFGEQILLFKIELNPKIRALVDVAFAATFVPAPLPWFEHESKKETKKAEALADDTSVLAKNDRGTLVEIKNNLTDFGTLSGLKCNFDKTFVMQVGDTTVIPECEDLGFRVVNSITLLGMEIDNNLDCLHSCHEKTLEKISNIITFWSRFCLSIQGRINIAKTLLLSQITYIGCIITPEPALLGRIKDTIEKFVKGRLNIGCDKIYGPVSKGGLGMISLPEFLIAQQAIWVKRVLSACCDNWRSDIFSLTFGNPAILSPALVDKNRNPILFTIAESFSKFRSKFLEINDNYKKGHIFMNPNLTRGRDNRGILDLQFFNQVPLIDVSPLVKLMLGDVFSDRPLQLEQINNTNGTNLNLNTYMRLMGACSYFIRSLKRDRFTNGTSISIPDFFKTFKRGSKSMRRILMNKSGTGTGECLKNTNTCKKYVELTGIDHVDEPQFKVLYSCWGENALQNRLREFAFKFTNNILGLNTRTVHFTDRTDRSCTFCSLKNKRQPDDETFLHLFFSCEQTENIRERFYQKFFNDLGAGAVIRKKLWFGFIPHGVRDKNLLLISILFIQHQIWEAKLKSRIPTYNRIELEFFAFITGIYKLKRVFFSNDPTFALSRNWPDSVQYGQH
jgi:Reverse transcriptase (RNA-dependent DNA polymerase)